MREKYLPLFILCLGLAYVLASFKPPAYSNFMNMDGFGRLPVLQGGRIKPLDTLARVSLLMLRGHQDLRLPNKTISAIEWISDVFFRPDEADHYPVFRVDSPDILGMLNIQQRKKPYYSFADLTPSLALIENQAVHAEQIKPELRSSFQNATVNLQRRLILYRKLESMMEFFPISNVDPSGIHSDWLAMSKAVVAGDYAAFNGVLRQYHEWLRHNAPQELSLASYEYIFNRTEPFYKSLLLYLCVSILTFLSWLTMPKILHRSASLLLGLSFVVHTLGLISRIVIQGRPPVTNLYSSAVFVGWVAVVLGLFLERMYKNGVGNLVSSTIGFLTLIIAHHLSNTGDTLEMMRAVLDSNFWLATHVVCVTIGYSSTFLAGFIALLYILRRWLRPAWREESPGSFEKMVYGIVCFSTFFSFLGTVLGGIWADQSWGRFWGWDPKENGALLIVLWNAFILHARWAGYSRGIRLMVMAVFGNIITSFSWFGVNMLGIGLHSYGFMDKAFVWLLAFSMSQIFIMGVGVWLRRKERA